MKPTPISGGKAYVELLENGVVNLAWQPKSCLQLDDVQAAMEHVDSICNGVPRPLLVEMSRVATVSADARAAFSAKCAASRIALLGSDPVDQVIATFRGAGSYPCPTRFFTDPAEAMDWLLQPLP